jgi:hypothetical protein
MFHDRTLILFASRVKDAIEKETESVSVQLYEVNDSFTDSIIFKKPPSYITNTLDSLKHLNWKTLKLENTS